MSSASTGVTRLAVGTEALADTGRAVPTAGGSAGSRGWGTGPWCDPAAATGEPPGANEGPGTRRTNELSPAVSRGAGSNGAGSNGAGSKAAGAPNGDGPPWPYGRL